MAEPVRLFLPGWAATAKMYRPAAPAGWTVLDLPTFRSTKGRLEAYVHWLEAEIVALRRPVVLGGHSLGGAIAMLAAAGQAPRVERLLLVSPSVLPLTKSAPASMRDLGVQIARGRFHATDLVVSGTRLTVAPRSAARLARAVRANDLSVGMQRVRDAKVDTVVVACTTDTLVTPDHCRRAARLLGATYRELSLKGGHLWMFVEPLRFMELLNATA